MHGRVLFLLGDLLGGKTQAGPVGSIGGFRNFLGPLAEADRFTAGGLIGPEAADPVAADQALRDLMAKLAQRIERAGENEKFWSRSVPLPDAAESWENPKLPSGYTYLLQLIAHDIVSSACSVTAEGVRPGTVNTRTRPLALDTIYGSSPDELPLVYAFDRRHQQNQALIPRILLRLGPKREGTGLSTLACPFRDIARGRISAADASDDGDRLRLREALLADPRNDDNFVLSQLTVLWHLLHNHIVELLRSVQKPLPTLASPMARTYLLFHAARLATTLVYRRIIVQDVLPQVLHPSVRAHYLRSDLDDRGRERFQIKPESLNDNEVGIPLEFSHGAFRFGHAMVRSRYRVNRAEPTEPIDLVIKHTSMAQVIEGTKEEEPLFIDAWLVDWARFFCLERSSCSEGRRDRPNRSRRIGPSYTGVLNGIPGVPGEEPGLHDDGLAHVELRSASYARLCSVPKLFERLAARRLGYLALALDPPRSQDPAPSYNDVWRKPIEDWLLASEGQPNPLDECDIKRIASDPPLPFFILFEAAYKLSDGAPNANHPPNGGEHLGPVGSIIVAETIVGALVRHPIAFEKPDTTLEARLASCCSTLLGEANAGALAGLAAIGSMADLVGYLVTAGILGAQSPGDNSS